MSWLDANNLADKEEFEHQYKELQKVCAPIMAKMHGSGGPESGQPQQGTGTSTNKGPTVEEVD